jgi:hypothetical protein
LAILSFDFRFENHQHSGFSKIKNQKSKSGIGNLKSKAKIQNLNPSMSEPEIVRRCPQCGASIRERAFFCPQCGRPLRQNEEDEPEALTAVRASETDASEQARASTNKAKSDPSSDLLGEPGAHGTERGAHGTRDRIHRATTRARDVIEDDVMPSVQRIRKISTEVLDEAAYDPSLRFVLIAGALFLLFLLLLLLSKWVG